MHSLSNCFVLYVCIALSEARDISMHLKPLRHQFENLEECEYLELPLRFPAVYHVVCLIWANSTHYRHPARLVVLLQEVSNLVIELVRTVTSNLCGWNLSIQQVHLSSFVR